MAEAPWRCSQCGTVNEPVANACRSCGRWPSLFELEASSLEEAQPGLRRDEAAYEVESLGSETFEVDETYVEGVEDEEELQSPADRRRRILRSLLLPLAVVVYLLVSILSDR